MKRVMATAAAMLLIVFAPPAFANAATLTVTVKLPNGNPAKHAFVRMYRMGANYTIVSLQTQTTNANGVALFKARMGSCLKAEYGNDGSGRPQYIGHTCPANADRSATITLSK